MQRKTLFHIVPEGWLILFALAIIFLIVNAGIGVWAALPVLVAMAICVLFFRDSPRNVPAEPLSVIAPVDGIVVHRRECYDPYLDREAVKIAIRVNPFGAYLLRSPVEGTVVELAGEAVERVGGAVSMIRTDEGDELVVAIRHGSLLGQRPYRSGYGERVGQGRCCGNRRLARRIEILLPVNSRMEVELGDHVRAGACVLARLVHKQNGSCRAGIDARRTSLDGAA
ncbi:hypothetical protein [Salinisphaera sp.]|uniref:hypothetical protein n=1 Tax=Salinisphaera sp. TaxID=1914330 RepID=UPI002D7A338E|nr:hypothetical protein [Salinisphaera sp.]HET7315685.1 hypothetical protein [Salinisphaera sp.]